MSLLIIGTVAFDTIESFRGKRERIVGGSGMYSCIAASKIYDRINLCSIVGEDFGEDNIQKLFKDRNIGTEGLEIKKGEKTFFWSGKYLDDINQRVSLVTDLNVLPEFNPVIPESYQDCSFLFLANIDPKLQLKVLKQLKKRPKLVVLDTMNFYIENHREDLMQLIPMVDVLTVNEEEALLLTNEKSLVQSGETILSWGVEYVLIKKGEHGCLMMGKDGSYFSAPGLPLKTVSDPTGAGDSFLGGFISYLAKKGSTDYEDLKTAIIYGSCLASFCVEEFGNEKLIEVKDEDIKYRLKNFQELTFFKLPS